MSGWYPWFLGWVLQHFGWELLLMRFWPELDANILCTLPEFDLRPNNPASYSGSANHNNIDATLRPSNNFWSRKSFFHFSKDFFFGLIVSDQIFWEFFTQNFWHIFVEWVIIFGQTFWHIFWQIFRTDFLKDFWTDFLTDF